MWPFVERNEKLHYDCSKLDQWQVVFDHAQARGLFLHFKTQETENDDQRLSHERTPGTVPEALDGGAVGVERRLYYRELVARFGTFSPSTGTSARRTRRRRTSSGRWPPRSTSSTPTTTSS